MNDLVKRLEKAKGGSRELDAEIARLFGAEARHVGEIGWKMRNAPWRSYDTSRWCILPDLTSSIDDAVNNLAVGKSWSVTLSGDRRYGATVGDFAADFKGRTAPLALCIAAVKNQQAA